MLLCSCGSSINSVSDEHFDADGSFVKDTSAVAPFTLTAPITVKFFVEVSGSMNGFFRPNIPTQFKADVWEIMSYLSSRAPEVTILTNNGDMGRSFPMAKFQTQMNTGAFISSSSTKVPLMLKTILQNLNTDEGEVAVLISDMKYSPVGAAAPEVLLSQYGTDVSNILGKYNKAVCLIGATSDYADRRGRIVCENSPYYYFVIGNGEQVAVMRNVISTFLQNNNHFIDNIEGGFNYGRPSYSFGMPENCYQMADNEPTFCGVDDTVNGTCTIKLKVDLENYRWLIAQDTTYFNKAFKAKMLHGSSVKVGNVELDVNNIVNKYMRRKATAIVDLQVSDMADDSDVIEWTLTLPDIDFSNFLPYLGATSEGDLTKSYSLEGFIKGIFYGGVVNSDLPSNYILVSKNE